MLRIKIPFQFKIYLLIIFLIGLLLQLIITRVNQIVSSQMIAGEYLQLEGVKTLFYNLLRSKIESLENEALLLAGQNQIQQSLEMLNEGRLVESFLVSSYPRTEQRELVILTDSRGKVVDGKLTLWKRKESQVTRDTRRIQQFMEGFPLIQEVLHGTRTVSYILGDDSTAPSLFAVVSTPVWDMQRGDTVVGTVTLGFPVDESLARDLRSGSRFDVGFLMGNRIITSTLDSERTRDLRETWDRTSAAKRRALLDKPELLTLYNEPYLAFAASLPTSQSDQGLYLILCSMEETFHSLRNLKNSVIWVSILLLGVTLLIGYFLARGVIAPVKTLAVAVSKMAEGDYTVDASIRTGDELETLGEEVHHMAQTLARREAEIREYVRQIEEWNKELESKVTERTKDLEERNFRLNAMTEELGRVYAQIDDELKIVGELQKDLLPRPSLDMNGLRIRSFYLPNGRAGGDYYDFIATPRKRLFVLIADVSGHGTPAAFIMAITRAIVHTLIGHIHSPAEVLQELSNKLIKTIRSGEFVTMFLGRLDLDTRRLTYSVAGQTPPFLLRTGTKQLEELGVQRGIPLGILENFDYEEVAVDIQPGDRLLLYTDGIVEASNEGKNLYGEERLRDFLRKYADLPPEDLLDALTRDLEEFVQRPLEVEPLEDDVTLVAIDFLSHGKSHPGESST